MPESEEVCQTAGIQLPGNIGISKQRLDLRSKRELAAALVIVERFFTYPITRKKQPLLGNIPDGNREHAIKAAEAIHSPLFVRMQDYFSIAACLKDMAPVFKLRAQLQKIVKLAIKNEAAATIFVPNRLVTTGHVDNA